MSLKETLLARIAGREMMCGVIGLGYVGLPLAVEKAKAGFRTIGFDVQPKKVELVNSGVNYIGDVCGEELSGLVRDRMLAATNDFDFIREADFIAICVPTPLDSHQQPDLGCVRDSVAQIAPRLRRGHVVVLESTTYPGTTRELVRPMLESGSGLVCGEDFFLGFSPERVDPGNAQYNTKNTPKVVGAIGEDAREVIAALYREVLDGEVYTVSSPAVAEMEKLLENSYRNVNIALVNELAKLCRRMGVSVWEVIDAAKTKPYGFQAFYPGPGPGGHCIPLDPYYLSWKAREYGFHISMLDAATAVNDSMAEYCVSRAEKLLGRSGKPMCGANVLLLGVAYKQDIADCRESPALKVMELLRREGAQVSYHDPWVRELSFEGERMMSRELYGALEEADLVMVTAAHTNVDYDRVAQSGKPVFDMKNAMKAVKDRGNIEVL